MLRIENDTPFAETMPILIGCTFLCIALYTIFTKETKEKSNLASHLLAIIHSIGTNFPLLSKHLYIYRLRNRSGIILVAEMALFAFLKLGRETEGFKFLKYWLEIQPWSQKEVFLRLPQAGWLETEADMFEDILGQHHFTLKTAPGGFALALLAFKIRCLNNLIQNETNVANLDQCLKEAKPESDLGILKQSRLAKDCLNLFLMGPKTAHQRKKESTNHQIAWLLNIIHEKNEQILPAIHCPFPLLQGDECYDSEDPDVSLEISQAKMLLQFSWKYFSQLRLAQALIFKFLWPNHPGLKDLC